MVVGCARIGDSFGGDDDGSEVPDEVTDVPDDAWTRLATARCEARSRCECAEPLDMATCLDTYVAQLSEEVAGLELQFSPACFEEILDFYAEVRCETWSEVPSRPQCRLMAGDGREPCIFTSLPAEASTCRWGSQCHSDGACRDGYPFLHMGIGEPCPDGTACSLEAYCAGPNAEAPGTCQPTAKVGEACEPGSSYEGCETLCTESACSSIECVDGVCQPPSPYVCLGPV